MVLTLDMYLGNGSDVRVGFLVTRRAAERLVVTASKCGIHCFNFYVIPFRNRAVIMRHRVLWLHGNLREGKILVGDFFGLLVPLL
jgi:hypothetical protein